MTASSNAFFISYFSDGSIGSFLLCQRILKLFLSCMSAACLTSTGREGSSTISISMMEKPECIYRYLVSSRLQRDNRQFP